MAWYISISARFNPAQVPKNIARLLKQMAFKKVNAENHTMQSTILNYQSVSTFSRFWNFQSSLSTLPSTQNLISIKFSNFFSHELHQNIVCDIYEEKFYEPDPNIYKRHRAIIKSWELASNID